MSSIRLGHAGAFLVASCLIAALPIFASAQDAPQGASSQLGSETENWGLAPFIPIVTLNLSAEGKQKVRDLEDRQITERRELEDRYEAEVRTLLLRQAEEREALTKLLVGP